MSSQVFIYIIIRSLSFHPSSLGGSDLDDVRGGQRVQSPILQRNHCKIHNCQSMADIENNENCCASVQHFKCNCSHPNISSVVQILPRLTVSEDLRFVHVDPAAFPHSCAATSGPGCHLAGCLQIRVARVLRAGVRASVRAGQRYLPRSWLWS